MRTAVYSGSFDPLHIGHLAILRHLCSSAGFDRVLLVLSPQNPLKSADRLSDSTQRYNNLVARVANHPELNAVAVDDIEMKMDAPHYTIRTLDALRKRDPHGEFTLVIGADNLDCIRKWKDYGRILSEYGVLVYPRTGYDLRKIREELLEESGSYRIQLARVPTVDISSTQIREGEEEGRDMSAYRP